MNVKLVSITAPLIEGLSVPEDLIVYCARVSNPSNQMNMETGPKLIRYLINNQHWSPFEMVDMTVEIKTSRAIAAQILRHRSFSFQEFSQRYAQVQNFEEVELRQQGNTNRQVGEDVITTDVVDFITHEVVPSDNAISRLVEHSYNLYSQLIENGVARESARMILPLCTQTTLYMKGSIRSWIHYLGLRTSTHTQKEHRLIAEEIKNIFKDKFPDVFEAVGF